MAHQALGARSSLLGLFACSALGVRVPQRARFRVAPHHRRRGGRLAAAAAVVSLQRSFDLGGDVDMKQGSVSADVACSSAAHRRHASAERKAPHALRGRCDAQCCAPRAHRVCDALRLQPVFLRAAAAAAAAAGARLQLRLRRVQGAGFGGAPPGDVVREKMVRRWRGRARLGRQRAVARALGATDRRQRRAAAARRRGGVRGAATARVLVSVVCARRSARLRGRRRCARSLQLRLEHGDARVLLRRQRLSVCVAGRGASVRRRRGAADGATRVSDRWRRASARRSCTGAQRHARTPAGHQRPHGCTSAS
jgi:hypothetical protein